MFAFIKPSCQVPTLFTEQEFERLKKLKKQEILHLIQSHGFVRKTDERLVERFFYLLDACFNLGQGKKKSIRLFQRGGKLYTKYSYPFVPSGRVVKSTRAQVTGHFPSEEFTILGLLKLGINLRPMIVPSDWDKAIKGIEEVYIEHQNRITNQYLKAIQSNANKKETRSVRLYFSRYYPKELWELENSQRVREGKKSTPYQGMSKQKKKLRTVLSQLNGKQFEIASRQTVDPVWKAVCLLCAFVFREPITMTPELEEELRVLISTLSIEDFEEVAYQYDTPLLRKLILTVGVTLQKAKNQLPTDQGETKVL